MNDNFYNLLQSRFPTDRSRPCLESQNLTYSYADLAQEIGRCSRALQQSGLVKGDVVAVQVHKSPQNLFIYLGCLKAGLIYLPLNTAYKQTEIEYFLADAEPGLVVCDPDYFTQISDIASRQRHIPIVRTLARDGSGSFTEAASSTHPECETVACTKDDIAVILYTSGTTGKPKGAMISHGNLVSNSLVLHAAWGWQENDVMLHALPIYHVHGLFLGCHLPLLNASKIIFLDSFDTDLIIRELPRSTVYMGVPTHYTRLLKNKDFQSHVCSNMRLFTSGSAPLLEKTFAEFQERSGHTILERYGMTETGMNTSNPLHGMRKAGTVGPVLSGVEARIVDTKAEPVAAGATGQLQVRGDNVFKGYWRMPEKTAEEFTADGFFKTGDLATIDQDQYISIVGRSKDLIITGGLNVYPKEIESILDRMQGVTESAVIGLAHPDFGEAVTAIVVRDDTADPISASDIISSLKQTLANFKVPKKILFVESLPRNTMGKVQKNILRNQFDFE
jgi:malonyl-CoA/methylmalonyl-CoA synthetase